MTHDQFEHDVCRISEEPSYAAGYRAGLAGGSTPQHYAILRDQVAWSDGWEAGATERAMRAETIADWISQERPRVTVSRRANNLQSGSNTGGASRDSESDELNPCL
jgi:ribosome modulation factor